MVCSRKLPVYLRWLGETVPAALCSVSSATIHRHYLHCMRIIHAYGPGATFGPRNLRSRCIRLTGRLLTSQSGKSCSNIGRGSGGWSGGTGLELLAFVREKISVCIIPEFVHDHPRSLGLPFLIIHILYWVPSRIILGKLLSLLANFPGSSHQK